jgi:hypothetical protein
MKLVQNFSLHGPRDDKSLVFQHQAIVRGQVVASAPEGMQLGG